MTSIYNTTNFSSNSYIYYVQQTCAYMHVYWFTTGGQHQAPSVEDPECSCHSPGAGHVPEDSDPDRTEKICKSSLIFIVDVIYITGTLKKICVKIFRHDYFTKRGVSCLYGYHVYQLMLGLQSMKHTMKKITIYRQFVYMEYQECNLLI